MQHHCQVFDNEINVAVAELAVQLPVAQSV